MGDATGKTGPDTVQSILIVEDQVHFAMMSQEILELEGYMVDTVRGGAVALEMLAAGLAVDLVITDIQMDGLDGFELASEIKQLHPDCGIIYVTGLATAATRSTQGLHGPLLHKPVAPSDLIATVKEVLAGLPDLK